MISTSSEGLTNLVREVLTHHILEVSPDPMFIVDGDNRVMLANRAVQRLGWTADQLVGRRWDDLVVEYEGTATHIVSSNVAASAPGVAIARDGRLRCADGSDEPARFVTYRLWLGSGTAPTVVIAECRRTAPGRRGQPDDCGEPCGVAGR